MGCDIHSIVEVKQNGVWKVNRKRVFPNPYYCKDEKSKPKEQQWALALNPMETSPNDRRNYDWFAILANVRNGRGFAGVRTGEGFAVIAEPRGIPDDATPKWLKIVEDWRGDMHSHSYLYIQDFNNFDWNQVTMKTGVITMDEYRLLRFNHEAPNSWCGAISGDNCITVDEQLADQIIAGEVLELTRTNFWDRSTSTKPVKEWSIYVEYNWPVIYSEWFKYEIENIIEPMRKLAAEYEDVRLVFGFDN